MGGYFFLGVSLSLSLSRITHCTALAFSEIPQIFDVSRNDLEEEDKPRLVLNSFRSVVNEEISCCSLARMHFLCMCADVFFLGVLLVIQDQANSSKR
jgi:hypothetical protein